MDFKSPDTKTSPVELSSASGISAQPPPYSRENFASASGSGASGINVPGTLSSTRPTYTTAIFSRQPSQNVLYPTFKPISLVALGKYLNKGFMRIIPPSHEHPHPLVGHDIGEEEWLSFLDVINQAGLLSDKEEQSATNLPIIGMIPIVSAVLSHGIRSYLKNKKSDSVVQIIDRWNHHFFHPRRTEVLLLKGTTKLSGLSGSIGALHISPPLDVSRLGLAYTEANAQSKDSTYRLFVAPITVA